LTSAAFATVLTSGILVAGSWVCVGSCVCKDWDRKYSE
jgi:hypothetical protein